MNLSAAPPRQAVVAVAFSGGRDSLALLHATCRAARALGLEVLALHVHHGLLAPADDWARSASRLCSRWRVRGLPVRLRCHRVAARPASGDSVEAWARRERYAALGAMAREEGIDLVLLGHHRRDQAETVVLQALRGAGPRGLAAMPRSVVRDGITWARPWLDRPREAIDAYVRRHRLRPLEDPSNLDPRLARSRLRLQVWPALNQAFTDAEVALSTLARKSQLADAALAELAQIDLSAVADEAGLQVPAWLALSVARQSNVLRAWLGQQLGRGAPDSLVDRLRVELRACRRGRWPLSPDCELTLYRGVLSRRPLTQAEPGAVMWVDLSAPGRVDVPEWGGGFEIRETDAHGVSPHRLRALMLRFREGGEKFQRTSRSPPRSLKKQYQAQGVAAGERRGPLVWAGDSLLFVPGLGIDARLWAAAGEPQLSIEWIERRAPG